MTAALTWNRYGKSRVRLVKIRRAAEAHDVLDLTIDLALEGAFEAVYTDGDNQSCLATDTMKNTVYALARRDPIDHVETFALRLAEHFAAKPGVSLVRIDAAEHPWDRLPVAGRPHPTAFVRRGDEEWTVLVTGNAAGLTVTTGLRGLLVLKTADSAFAGFPRDEYTTLPDTRDRLLATSITAAWDYVSGFSDFAARTAVRTALAASPCSTRCMRWARRRSRPVRESPLFTSRCPTAIICSSTSRRSASTTRTRSSSRPISRSA
jgi:urate oxidase